MNSILLGSRAPGFSEGPRLQGVVCEVVQDIVSVNPNHGLEVPEGTVEKLEKEENKAEQGQGEEALSILGMQCERGYRSGCLTRM